MTQCKYCFKNVKDDEAKCVDVKAYCAGKIEWQHLGATCLDCIKYLRGVWRYCKCARKYWEKN